MNRFSPRLLWMLCLLAFAACDTRTAYSLPCVSSTVVADATKGYDTAALCNQSFDDRTYGRIPMATKLSVDGAFITVDCVCPSDATGRAR